MGAQPVPEEDKAMVESGQKFGKYRLLERLASGGMAEIYKAGVEDAKGRQQLVAIKRLHDQYSQDREFATMLVDEAKLAVQLQHPHIGGVFDLECIDGQYFIVMEYIDGLDCKQMGERLRQGRRHFPVGAAVAIGAQVASALHYAHTKRGLKGQPLEIVHRDVSPQNIMVSLSGEVKLVDFGIAKAEMRAQHTRAGVIKGKFYYMSPEQAHGGRLDGRSDVYALAMVLYELLAGGHPYDRVSDGELMSAVKRADFPPVKQAIPRLEGGLAELLEKGLARQKEHRFESARAFEQALRSYGERAGMAGTRDLASMVEALRGGGADSSGLAMMGSEVFTVSEHSVIFDAGVRPFESDPSRLIKMDDKEVQDEVGTEPEGLVEVKEGGGRTMLIGVGVVVIVAALGGGFWWVQGGSAEDASLGFSIATSPEGARVFYDDVRLGDTPMQWEEVEEGERYELRLEKEGYEPREIELRVGAEGTSHYLELVPKLGRLEVQVKDGRDARIYVDGEFRGEGRWESDDIHAGDRHELEVLWPSDEEEEEESARQVMEVSWERSEERHQRVVFEERGQAGEVEALGEASPEEDELEGAGDRGGRGGALTQ